MNAQVLEALGLPEDADAASVMSAIAELKVAVEETTGLTPEDVDGFRALATTEIRYALRVHETHIGDRRETRERERERLLAVAVEEGRIREDDVPALRVLYDLDFDHAKDVLLAVPGPDGSRHLGEIINR